MAKQTINVGTSPNDGTGTPLRTAFQYTNSNFTELYTAVGPSGNNIVVPGTATITGDLTVDTNVLKVDSANNRVGILTATPGAPLDILGNGLADALLIRGNDNANCKIRMVNSGGSGEEFSLSVGYPGASNSSFVIRSITAGINRYVADQTGAHFWATNAGTAMTLNSTGLGVGVTPSTKLHIGGTGSQVLRVQTSTSGDPSLNLLASGVNDAVIAYDRTNNYLRFDVSATVGALRLDPSGNVGISVTPSALTNAIRLEIGGALSSNMTLRSTSTSPSARNWMVGANVNAFGDFVIRQGNSQGAEPNSGTDRLVIDLNGNLLVGTNTVSGTINGAGAITAKGLAGITTQTVSALATDYTLPIGAFAGILTVRSNGGGGSAVWMLDPNAGAVQISSNIVGRTITFTFSGGSWKMQQTVGTVPSTYSYLVLATQ